jgi:hypothetical protein
MAVMALLNQFLSVNAVNLSDHMRQAALAVEATTLDASAMGDGWVKNIYGLKSGSIAVEWNDDFVAGSVDATLWPLLGTNVAFELRPDGGVVSVSNPKYTGLVGIASVSIGGSLNEVARRNQTWPTSGAITRATA